MDEKSQEAAYKEELKANGVEIPEEEAPQAEEPAKPDTPPAEPEPEKKEETPEPEKEPEKPEEHPVREKRSIYQEYKEKKQELRSEREARENLEKELQDLRGKLEEIQGANSHTKESEDVLKYAEEVGADPVLVQRIIEAAKKDIAPVIPEDLQQGMKEFQEWKAQNSRAIEQQLFDREFDAALPFIKGVFPTANDEEVRSMKAELDKLSHSKEMHDKELDYVIFKNRQHLASLVSPKKRGIEGKGRIEGGESTSEFNPEADISKMSSAQMAEWEKSYLNAVNSDRERMATHGGKKMIL